jgi:hypothetical protein
MSRRNKMTAGHFKKVGGASPKYQAHSTLAKISRNRGIGKGKSSSMSKIGCNY